MNPTIRLVTVEDNPADAAYIEALLEGNADPGFELRSFDRLTPALDHVERFGADCMLVDLSLPDSHGLETITAIRARHPRIPVVVLTGARERDLGVRAIHRGADDFLDKNHIDEHVLLRSINHCVERRRIAQQLQASERHYRRLVEAAPDIVIRGRIVDRVAFDYVGPAVERLLGISSSTAHDPAVLYETIHPDDRPAASGPPWSTGRGEPAQALRHLCDDGRVVWLEPRLFVSTDPQTGIVEFEGLLRDVTAMKRAESERRQMEYRFRSAFAGSPVAMAVVDAGGAIVDSNEAYRVLVGHRNAGSLQEVISDADALLAQVGLGQDNPAVTSEHRLLPLYDSPVWCSAQITTLDSPDGPADEHLVQLVDITERKRAVDALASALEQEREVVARLREIEQVRADFVATVSHELRTPLTSVSGCLEMLRELREGLATAQEDELVSLMERGVQRLGTTVENLLEFSRLEAGGLEYRPIRMDLANMIHDAVLVIAPTAEAKGVTIGLPDVDPSIFVMGEPAQIDRVLLNVLTNAVKYTPAKGTVRVEARRRNHVVTIRITDTGIGMSDLDQQQLFTRFFRSTAAGVRNIQGTGLGLFIVKRIVEHHGGSVHVTSTLGQGTTVELTLPVAADQEREGDRGTGDGPPQPTATPVVGPSG